VSEAAQRFGIPATWIRAVMRAESAGDPRAVSLKGAMGLMQIMPATWAELRLRHGLGPDPFSPRDSILAGAAYLREMHDRYGSVALMLAAYNAGPVRTDEHLATGRALPAETRAYVAALVPELAAEAAPAILASTHAAPADDLFAAPIFVVRAGGPDAAPVRTDARRVAALTADEARFMAWQSGLFATPAPQSERDGRAEESAATLQPERGSAAHELRTPDRAATLFVPRSQPSQRP
jgi:soluble lytic murein transglycosylase-like protein